MNRPMIVSKDFFHHLLELLRQRSNDSPEVQRSFETAIDAATLMLQKNQPLNWEAEAQEQEGILGGSRSKLETALSGPEVDVFTFEKADGHGVKEAFVCGISWMVDNSSDAPDDGPITKGTIITAVNDRTIFSVGQKFDAIVLQSPQASFVIKRVQIVKYCSGVSIDDIGVDETWEYVFESVSGWRKEPYVVKEGEIWRLKN